MSLISPGFQINFRELCVSLVLRQITDIFEKAGISKGVLPPDRVINGERRALVEQYYQSINWTNIQDVQKFLTVIGLVFAQTQIADDVKVQLRGICEQEGLYIEGTTVKLSKGASGAPIQNIIFAANGPKPEIVLSDSTTNQIKIVANAEYCLVYDRPIGSHGLLWTELISWWEQSTGRQNLTVPSERELADRLFASLNDSVPERLFLGAYLTTLRYNFGEHLPALLPQVYLHYDPYTIRQLHGGQRLARQRMDFLLLLPHDLRIVVEIDGRQHYATADGQASPRLYAEMVAEDRRLKLAGYEVYRFGGYEFQDGAKVHSLVADFFGPLFQRHLGR